MDKFYVITNMQKDPQLKVAKGIQKYLEKRGKECLVQEMAQSDIIQNYKYTDPAKIPLDVECVLVLGGDGTVLQASRDLVERDIPLFGINIGTLGYLAEIGADYIEPALDKLILDDYVTEKRMMLQGTAYHGRKHILSDVALNDIVISRSGRLRVIDVNIFVNDRFLNSYSADGIIVSTPTGSTGYNLSVGGPIVSPSASMILLTPIAPHTLTARSVILPDDAKVKIEIERRNGSDEEAEVTFDGDTSVKMKGKDFIEIEKSNRTVRFVKIDQISFLEILRRKMSGA
ncbi:MAG: NAD(+)/NADH kinase [Eubacteriales bacterium]|nr:NAD(+)/NADH kinase [Eubacteriales bacterium]